MEKIEILIGRRIREARLKANMSQSDLAKSAKSSLTTINRIENGKQAPHAGTLDEIAKALNIHVVDLYRIDTDQKNESSKSDLILDIQSRLTALNHDELAEVLGFINDLGDRVTSTSITKKHSGNF